MKERTKQAVSIVGYFGVFLAVITVFFQLYDRLISTPSIEVFEKNIYLTSSNSGTGLIEFLARNDEKIIYADTFIDTSMAIEEHSIVEEQCGVDIEAVVAKDIIGVPLTLPVYENIDDLVCTGNSLVLDIGENTTYEYSSGGTGIVMVRFKGFFEISTTDHPGPSIHYHLKEVEVPCEINNKMSHH